MIKVNGNYAGLQGSYLFSDIAKRVAAYKAAHADADIISLGIGDVTSPLVPAVVSAMHSAAEEMGTPEGFHGYGPEQGYAFLRDLIAANDYAGLGIAPDEIFVSDGSKCDCGNIQELLSDDCVIAVVDPVYPVYVDTNVMAGRAGAYSMDKKRYDRIVYLPSTADNNFTPALPDVPVDVVYLCSPGNPTGVGLDRTALKVWVDWALKNDALILFDAAYERFITEDKIPHSIFEIEGARKCAIEFRSFSKTAGFTGTRCAFTVIPKELTGKLADGTEMSLHAMWNRRHTTKFNGVSYVVQRAAAAIYSPEGREQVTNVIAGYLANAKLIREGLSAAGITSYGGVNSPYIWLKTPGDMKSWDFFDILLDRARVVGTPGAGFGAAGEGYFRLTAFNTPEKTRMAIDRISALEF